MARVMLKELREAVRRHTDWQREGFEPPEQVLHIRLPGESAAHEEIIDQSLVGKTLSYEGREVTVVLDFDEKGYLVGIELV